MNVINIWTCEMKETFYLSCIKDQNGPFRPINIFNAIFTRKNIVEIQTLYIYHKCILIVVIGSNVIILSC